MAGLIKDQHGSGSLPSFPDIFQSHYSSLPNREECQDNIGSPEDIDELDKEISQIVEQATASGQEIYFNSAYFTQQSLL